jgi:hypothetical protein
MQHMTAVVVALVFAVDPVTVWHADAVFLEILQIVTKLGVARMPRVEEAKNRPNIDWQEKIHRGILRGPIIFSETP